MSGIIDIMENVLLRIDREGGTPGFSSERASSPIRPRYIRIRALLTHTSNSIIV